MRRRIYLVGVAICAAAVVSTPALAMVAIWARSNRAGDTAFLTFGVAFVSGVALLISTEDGAPARGLPRAERKRLREHERAARLQAEIDRVDRELGLD